VEGPGIPAWRYERNPDHAFHFHRLLRNGTLEGLLVSTEHAGWRSSASCSCRPARSPTAAGSSPKPASTTRARGSTKCTSWDTTRDTSAPALEGFASRPAPGNVFVGRALDDDALTERMAQSSRWTITYGDGDFV
jgi:hypothetical protein